MVPLLVIVMSSGIVMNDEPVGPEALSVMLGVPFPIAPFADRTTLRFSAVMC
jgi:hypothetical protein